MKSLNSSLPDRFSWEDPDLEALVYHPSTPPEIADLEDQLVQVQWSGFCMSWIVVSWCMLIGVAQ